MDELEIDYTNNQTKKVAPILIVFYQHVIKYYKLMRDNVKKKSIIEGKRSVMLDAFDYMYAMTNMAIQFGTANSYLNIPILTIFKIVGHIKYRMTKGEIINQDIKHSVDTIVRFLGIDFIDKVMTQKRIQLVRYDLPSVDAVSINKRILTGDDVDKWDPESDIDNEKYVDKEIIVDARYTDSTSSSYPSRFEPIPSINKKEETEHDKDKLKTDNQVLRLAGKNIELINFDNFEQLDTLFDKLENDRKIIDKQLFEKYSSSNETLNTATQKSQNIKDHSPLKRTQNDFVSYSKTGESNVKPQNFANEQETPISKTLNQPIPKKTSSLDPDPNFK